MEAQKRLSQMVVKKNSENKELVSAAQWKRILVSPEIIASQEDGKNHRNRARDFFVNKLNKKNQLYVASILGVEATEANKNPITSVFRSEYGKDLINLCTFARQTGILAAASSQYETYFSQAQRRSHRADLSNGSLTLQPLAKLVHLVLEESSLLENVFLVQKWRSRATQESFVANRELPSEVAEAMSAAEAELSEAFSKSGTEVTSRLFLQREIEPGHFVFLFQRETSATQQADYRKGLQVHFGFGWVLFSIDLNRKRVAFKGGGQECSSAVRRWLESHVEDLVLAPEGFAPFTGVDFGKTSNLLLGGYEKDSEVDILELRLERCNRRSYSPISVGPPLFGGSIREDLAFLRETNGIALFSLFDLSRIKVRYRDNEIQVNASETTGGTFQLRANDANISEQVLAEFYDAFEQTFGLPLGVRIDPRITADGHASAIAFLLDSTLRRNVPVHLEGDLEELIELSILSVKEVRTLKCPESKCDLDIITSSVDECPRCHSKLVRYRHDEIERNQDGIYRYLQRLLKKNTRWKLLKGLESEQKLGEVYRLEPELPNDIPFAVLVAPQSDSYLLRRCEKFHRPVVVVHTHGHSGFPYMDTLGMVHFHLSDLIAFSRSPEPQAEFFERFNELLRASQNRTEEILLRAAAVGERNLDSQPPSYNDQDFERDVFSIFRRLFTGTEKWGGGNKADGFISIPYTKSGELRTIQQYNFSYDAKLTSKTKSGYDLNKSEKRKAFEYVLALQHQPLLQTSGNCLNAHVFVSNFITEDALRGVAEHFTKSHNQDSLAYPIDLLVIRTDFLAELHEAFAKQRSQFEARALFVGRFISEFFGNAAKSNPILHRDDAKKLTAAILEAPAYAKPVDGQALGQKVQK